MCLAPGGGIIDEPVNVGARNRTKSFVKAASALNQQIISPAP